MFTVLIKGLEFYGYHGVPAEERTIGHRFRADIDVEVEGDTLASDNFAETVDYGSLAASVLRIAQTSRFQTVERLAAEITGGILAEFPMAKSVEITLMKRMPPMPVIAEEAGVRLKRSRS